MCFLIKYNIEKKGKFTKAKGSKISKEKSANIPKMNKNDNRMNTLSKSVVLFR